MWLRKFWEGVAGLAAAVGEGVVQAVLLQGNGGDLIRCHLQLPCRAEALLLRVKAAVVLMVVPTVVLTVTVTVTVTEAVKVTAMVCDCSHAAHLHDAAAPRAVLALAAAVVVALGQV